MEQSWNDFGLSIANRPVRRSLGGLYTDGLALQPH